MENNESEPRQSELLQHNQGGEDDTQSNPVTGQENDTEDTVKNAPCDTTECGVDSSTEGLGSSLHSSSENSLSEVDKDAGNSSKDTIPLVDKDGDGFKEQQNNISCEKTKDDKPDGPAVPPDEDYGDNQGAGSQGKNAQGDGHLESTVNENQEFVSQEAPTAGHIGEGEVETIGPCPDGESPPISHAPASVEGHAKGSDCKEAVGSLVTSEQQGADNCNRARNFWIAVAFVALAAVLLQQWLQPESPPPKTNLRQIDIFHQEMEKVKVQFPSQREELWKRSRIHLQRHFQITQPTEPVSLILTGGVRAEGTLRCLAHSIASALSFALNTSALHIDGESTSSEDSDKVKSDIDGQLQRAFEGGKPIAVIHRFEELPPASTLIFYRYCDHENAAFKKTFIIFTVLLGEEEEIQAKIRLREVEEMVTDHLQNKFLSNGHPTAFDKMDIDKYGGLWSRISHLILPVATEKRIENSEHC